MYKVVQSNGDSVAVPRLLFTKLATPCQSDARFRVALLLLDKGQLGESEIASQLRVPVGEVLAALQFWEGAGLIERVTEAGELPLTTAARRRLTSREVVAKGSGDPMLGGMVSEIQRIFGGVVSQSDINIFATLYSEDGIPADLILLAASYFASKGKTSARYIEKTLLAWRREGICTSEDADRYFKQLALREQRENEIAGLLGQQNNSFTLTERKYIACWYEEYGFNSEMIQTARMFAGEKANEIRYLNGILKNWHNKGWRSPKDVQQVGEGHNLRTTTTRRLAPEDDIMMNAVYVREG